MGREFQENICTTGQLSHPWQHTREGSAGAPRGAGTAHGTACLGTACSRGRDGPRGHQDVLQAQGGAACPCPLQPGTVGNVNLTPCRALGECLEQLHPKCKPSD